MAIIIDYPMKIAILENAITKLRNFKLHIPWLLFFLVLPESQWKTCFLPSGYPENHTSSSANSRIIMGYPLEI